MPKETILVVEDQADLSRLTKLSFEQAGYRVFVCKDAESALPVVRRQKPDLLVLDVNLPKMDGFELCRLVRQETQVPIVFLTGRSKELDQVLGLRLGADDYVTKPFSSDVLLARVQSVLRRSTKAPAAAAIVKFDGVELDLERHELRIKNKTVEATAKEYQLLELLSRSNGKVVSRDAILKEVWGYDKDMDVDTRTLDQLVSRLRKKLGPAQKRLATVPGYGYKLTTD